MRTPYAARTAWYGTERTAGTPHHAAASYTTTPRICAAGRWSLRGRTVLTQDAAAVQSLTTNAAPAAVKNPIRNPLRCVVTAKYEIVFLVRSRAAASRSCMISGKPCAVMASCTRRRLDLLTVVTAERTSRRIRFAVATVVLLQCLPTRFIHAILSLTMLNAKETSLNDTLYLIYMKSLLTRQ